MELLNQPPPNTWIVQIGFSLLFLLLGIPIGIWVNLWSNRIQDRKNAQKTKQLEKSRETQFAANQWAISYASNTTQLLAAQGRYNEVRNKELVWRLLGRAFSTIASVYITSMSVVVLKGEITDIVDVVSKILVPTAVCFTWAFTFISIADKHERFVRQTPSLLGYEIFTWINAIEGAPPPLSTKQIDAIRRHIETFDPELADQFERFMRKNQS